MQDRKIPQTFMTLDHIQSAGRRTVEIEQQAITRLKDSMDIAFAKAVQYIHEAKGRVIITGIGKSAIIAQKIVATMNSTGTPAVFMHAADAIHGDLGIILEHDTVICISKSGNTPEIKVLVPFIKNFNNKLVGMTSDKNSFLAKEADLVLLTPVDQEACPNGLAPTTSTTCQLVMGDALAVALLEMKGFTDADFARYHPGGSLGKKLYLRVNQLIKNNKRPAVAPEASLREVIVAITESMLGMTAVLEGEKLLGIITDGDLRRMLSSEKDIDKVTAAEIMTPSPKTIKTNAMAVKARKIMDDHNISQLIAMEGNQYAGVVHIHDLMTEGIM